MVAENRWEETGDLEHKPLIDVVPGWDLEGAFGDGVDGFEERLSRCSIRCIGGTKRVQRHPEM